jgi:hypothetical protein
MTDRFLMTVAAVVAGLCLAAPAGAQDAAAKGAASSRPNPSGAPNLNGVPNLSGVWNGAMAARVYASGEKVGLLLAAREGTLINFERDNALIRRMDPNKPVYRPEFWEKVQKLDQDGNREDPSYSCMPLGVPRMGPPTKIAQSADELIFLYAGPQDTYRVIPIDGRKHTPLQDLDGTWRGESVGHWEGDTMVVDTIGFNDTSWLDIGGYFHSENMRVIERLRRQGDMLSWQATVEDPDVLVKPWVMNARQLRLNPNPKAMLEETLPCSERDLSHLVTKEHH